MHNFPPRAWLYAGAVAITTALITHSLARSSGIPLIPLVGFGLLFMFAEFVPVRMTHFTCSVGYLVAICAVIATNPATAAAAAPFAALNILLLRRKDWLGAVVFNAGQLSLSTLALAAVYKAAGGTNGVVHLPHAFIPVILGTLAFFISNNLLVMVMVWLVRRVPMRDVLTSDFRATLGSYFLLASVGVVAAQLYANMAWAGVLFVTIPLLGARQAFLTAKKIEDTFEATLRSLVTALEAKDPYTRGHADRVSRLTEMLARARGVSQTRARRIRYAALLHDVGKVTIDTRVLQKPGKLTVDEYDHMKVHSERGAEIISEIDLLAHLVDGVRHHHERCDGKGYPDGLDAHSLSDVAKMIMTADAFDSMTSTRSYRKAVPMEKAFTELHRCEGEQFAPEMVAALEKAIAKWGWSPAPEEYFGETTPRPQHDVHAESKDAPLKAGEAIA